MQTRSNARRAETVCVVFKAQARKLISETGKVLASNCDDASASLLVALLLMSGTQTVAFKSRTSIQRVCTCNIIRGPKRYEIGRAHV